MFQPRVQWISARGVCVVVWFCISRAFCPGVAILPPQERFAQPQNKKSNWLVVPPICPRRGVLGNPRSDPKNVFDWHHCLFSNQDTCVGGGLDLFCWDLVVEQVCTAQIKNSLLDIAGRCTIVWNAHFFLFHLFFNSIFFYHRAHLCWRPPSI